MSLYTLLFLLGSSLWAQNPDQSASAGLDLISVGELFRTSSSLFQFEKKLNDPDLFLNNLDLDENNEVDYLRVMAHQHEDSHFIVLEAVLGPADLQTIATIEVQKVDQLVQVQVRGDVLVYGKDYYVHPGGIPWAEVAICAMLFQSSYRPYISHYSWNHYPPKWKTRKPLIYAAYVKQRPKPKVSWINDYKGLFRLTGPPSSRNSSRVKKTMGIAHRHQQVVTEIPENKEKTKSVTKPKKNVSKEKATSVKAKGVKTSKPKKLKKKKQYP